MSVMDGRRLRFEKLRDTPWNGAVYGVAAVAVSHVLEGPDWVSLGEVERVKVSTDSRIAGTRLRRSGKGRPGWRAHVPRSAAIGQDCCLQGTFNHGWRLVKPWSGQTFDTRTEAVEALVAWHDHPEKRELS